MGLRASAPGAAIRLIDPLPGWMSHAALYRLEPPLEYRAGDDDLSLGQGLLGYVVASAIVAFDTGEPETLVFPSDHQGKPLSFLEVGGIRGSLSHEEALRSMRYWVVDREGQAIPEYAGWAVEVLLQEGAFRGGGLGDVFLFGGLLTEGVEAAYPGMEVYVIINGVPGAPAQVRGITSPQGDPRREREVSGAIEALALVLAKAYLGGGE